MTLAATLNLSEASRRSWDVAIVGAGPAGALASRELARRGQSVLLIDRAAFPRWKVCGCCLNGHALATLRAVGLESVIERSGAVPLRSIRLTGGGCVAEVPLVGNVVLSREVFDTALVQAAIAAGVTFLPQTWASLDNEKSAVSPRISEDAAKDSFPRLHLRQGSDCRDVIARVVLAADGLGGKLTVRAGMSEAIVSSGARIGAGVVAPTAPAFYEPGRIFMACGRKGYLGLVRLEDGRLNLAAALDPYWVRTSGGPGRAAAELLSEAGWPAVPKVAELSWRGTAALTRQARCRARERLFLLGDAAGYIEPFTGEGMAWALAAASAIAPVAVRAVRHWHPALAHEWNAIYRRLIEPRQRICRAVAAVLRSPILTRTVLGLLAFSPRLAAPLTSYLGSGVKTTSTIENVNGIVLSN